MQQDMESHDRCCDNPGYAAPDPGYSCSFKSAAFDVEALKNRTFQVSLRKLVRSVYASCN